MSKQSSASRKLRAQEGLVAVPQRPASNVRKPLAFERQLKAAVAQSVPAPSPSWPETLYARIVRSLLCLRQRLLKRRTRSRKLDLLEIQQLGEKRFIALIRVGKQRFLIAGAAGSVTLLAEFPPQRATAARPPQQEGA